MASRGFSEQECGSDGNCLYRSAARGLRCYNFNPTRHRDLRLLVTAHIREYEKQYMEHESWGLCELIKAHLGLDCDPDFVNVSRQLPLALAKMEANKHWAESEFELRAIADATGATVVKISANPGISHQPRWEPSTLTGKGATADQPVVYLIHYHLFHFSAGFPDRRQGRRQRQWR